MAVNVETFTWKGETWTRYPAEQDEKYVIGVDIGQSSDPTAIAVLHYRRIPLESWTVKNDVRTTRQDVQEFFDVEHLERVKLGTPYPAIISYVAEMLQRKPLRYGADLVIDDTGVGRGVGDMFEAAGLKPYRITITHGVETAKPTPRRIHVPKIELISRLDAKLHSGELRIAADLQDAGALADELKDFRRHVSAAGRATFDARVGRHDDLVLAVATATWHVAKPKGQLLVGAVKGAY